MKVLKSLLWILVFVDRDLHPREETAVHGDEPTQIQLERGAPRKSTAFTLTIRSRYVDTLG
jgi:hypothetical protein